MGGRSEQHIRSRSKAGSYERASDLLGWPGSYSRYYPARDSFRSAENRTARMKIVSVNVGLPREVIWKGITVQTAIFKETVTGAVSIRELNLAGDQQADLTVHGGSKKAVYAYPAEHYGYWGKQLSDDSLPWGAFGENLTTEGLCEDTLCIGDVLRVGSAVLQITQPRMPCYKLEIKFTRDDMIK